MLNPDEHAFIKEFYVVSKSIEVQVWIKELPARIRIDALERLGTGVFSTRAYRQGVVRLEPTLDSPGAIVKKHAWVDFDLPWVERKSADEALNQAIGFLYQDCDK